MTAFTWRDNFDPGLVKAAEEFVAATVGCVLSAYDICAAASIGTDPLFTQDLMDEAERVHEPIPPRGLAALGCGMVSAGMDRWK